MNFKKLFISVLFLSHDSFAWQIIPRQLPKKREQEQEPVRDMTKSFDFPVHAHLDLADRLLVTAQQDNESKQFSLSSYDFIENTFKPLVHEKVIVNGVANQENPLFDRAINHIALADDALIATISSAPKKIFAVALPACNEILVSPTIKDAQDNEIACEITGLASGDKKIFAAIKDAIIVFVVYTQTNEIQLTQKELDDVKRRLQENGDEQEIERVTKEITTKDGKHTRKVTEKKIVQVSNTVCESAIVDLHWNTNLKRLFVATDKNLLVGYCEESGRLVLNPVQMDCGEISKIKSMLTTTALDYLIVLEADGNIYALPVLNFHSQEGIIEVDKIYLQGTLADSSAIPLEGFSKKDRAHMFLGRHFIVPAQSDCPSLGVNVGGGRLGIGPIDTIFVKDDAVYAIVTNPCEGCDAGIYYSHAIFDAYGRIAAWTNWQLKSLIDETVSSAYIDRLNGCLVVAAGKDERSIQTVKRTQWTRNQLTELVKQEFLQSTGGLHGLVDFPANTPGLNRHMIAFMGFGKLVLASMEKQLESLSFHDDVLQKLGPLSSCEIAFNNPYEYLFAGGVHGLAVLLSPEGLGWHIGAAAESFWDLPKNMRFKTIGDYSFVRKIIADEQFLYILTDSIFDRIDMSASDLNSGRLHITRLGHAPQLQESGLGIFIDAIVSEKCAVIITTTGIYCVGNNCDIRYDSQQTLQWVPLKLYDKAGLAISLIPISTTGRAQDLARNAGQLYVISGSIGNNTGHLHRFAISSVLNKPISDDTILPVRDFVAENHQSYFANIGNFTSLFATDGTLFFMQGMQRRKKINTQVINNNFGKYRHAMPLALGNDAVITCIARNSASGNWMIGGDFGLIVNE